MKLLYLLERLRHACPALAAVFAAVTYLGDEAAFLAAALFVIWCVSKRDGYYLLTVGFIGTVINQFLKIVCAIPRPWVRDPAFTVWESAKGAATGYSFPSGHTQNAVGTYGTLTIFAHRRARSRRGRIWATAIDTTVILCVAFSRMLLGVHTPADVLFSLGLGVLLITLCYPFFSKDRSANSVTVFVSAMAAVALTFVLFLAFWTPPVDIDPVNFAEAKKNAWTLLGACVGVLVISIVEPRFIRYETKAPPPAQAMKLILGLAAALLLKAGLKALFLICFGDLAALHAVRYFLVVLFAGLVWPLTFPFFGRIATKKERAEKSPR